ncbi:MULTISPECIES: DUF5381 family protein [Bacillaceae]|uniref:DUF5381 family protein n=1 Tax=Bacillaceae TaxID=186817 RepID=UPI0011A45A4F|nr:MULTISPECIES: DUF5381 family protein [Bacillaceae]MCM3123041.1 YfjD family protein [Mesobacillus sp. MER 33]MCM3233476.1 YfjD family protein [Mesobacillus sp. MER 48]
MEEHNIKVTENKVEVVYTAPGAGCMITSALFGTLLSAFVLFVVAPDSGIVRGFLVGIIGIIGLIFSGSILLKLISVILSGRTIFTIESGILKGRRKSIPINEIGDIKWGGSSLKYLVIKTINNQTIKLSTYNLVSEEKVNQVIEDFVIPDASPEFKVNWEKRMNNN